MHPRSLLVIDDDPLVCAAMGTRLETAGYRVRSAPGGPSGLEAARTEVPDLFLVDLQMPVMGGLEVCAQIRRDPRMSGRPVVLMSAGNMDPEMLRRARSEADAFLAKPYEGSELLRLVGSMVGSAGRGEGR